MLTAQSALSAWWFLPFAAPISIWVAWSDMATMKITNKSVLAMLVVFAVIGLVALPLGDYGWRWTHFAVVLVVGFVLNMGGLMGGGDAKFGAAMAPFIARPDIVMFLYLFAAVVLAAFVTHRLAKRISWIRARTEGWESWERRDFPMGLALGAAMIFYLLIGAIYGV
ncbi:prepilin peptidase [Aliiroseovarius subalbicans]|uniref:prepilin peptidase n=1 Tax=Aliiroseovarius subalbicans TaxID=2925840 RepID=UPI001F58CE9A|nr:prepilin peptidase [Aliiroseovarius subalbicans]MCI2397957.1 prepilin peptidase [Aliiroseovarius subalbicans]